MSAEPAGASDYEKARELGLTSIDRWETGHPHHPMSLRLMEFLEEHDFNDYGDYFCWKSGGDGDNGETLMYQMDAFFEATTMSAELMTPPVQLCGNCGSGKLDDTYSGWVRCNLWLVSPNRKPITDTCWTPKEPRP